MRLNLGIIRNESGQIVAHRSLLKVVCNPILRMFGFQIASVLDDNGELSRTYFGRCPRWRRVLSSYRFDMTGMTVEKRRRLV